MDETMSHFSRQQHPLARLDSDKSNDKNKNSDDSSSDESSCLEIVLPNGKSIDNVTPVAIKKPNKEQKFAAQMIGSSTDITPHSADNVVKTSLSTANQERRTTAAVLSCKDSDDSSSDDEDGILNKYKTSRAAPTNHPRQKRITATRNPLDIYSSTDEDDDDDVDDILKGGITALAGQKTGPKTIRKPAAAAPMNRTKPKTTTSKTNSASATAAAEARRRARLEKEEQKQQEKLAKAAKREEERAGKQRKKEQENESKKRQAEALQQASGKFAHKEIAVLLDHSLYLSEELALVDALSEDFLIHRFPSALTCNKAIQWVRKDYLLGGAQQAVDRLETNQRDHYEHLDRLTLILQPEEFIPLLQRGEHDVDEDDDYPALGTWVTTLISRWQTVWQTTKQPKIMLLLDRIPEALDRQWIELRKRGRKGELSPPTDAELHDAIQWILIQFQVECVLCDSIEKIQTSVHKLTRALCEAPYAAQVSELECIKKIKTHIDTSSESVTSLERAKDTWFRQLQQVPSLSETMARNLVAQYPTARSLWEAYQKQDHDDGDNSMLVADVLSGASRRVKLSTALYRFMTSNNPNEMLF